MRPSTTLLPCGNSNVLLEALGGTPRGSSQLSKSNEQDSSSFFPDTGEEEEKYPHTETYPGISNRRKRDRDSDSDLSRILSDKEDDEEKLPIIDPSERVEHRSTKLVRREIVIASPSGIDDDDNLEEK
ncbi:hypothetical protein LEN26_015248, partial [Aphanomyces euteiches]